MKTLHRYILKSYVGPFVSTFCIAVFILLMQFIWLYIDDLVGKGLEWSIIAQLLFFVTLTLVPMALPLAVLLSSIMTFGNLGENYELVALKSAGLSLRKIMMPLIILSVFMSLAAFYFSNNIMPYATLKMKSLRYDVQRQKPTLQLKEGVFYNGIEGYSIRVGKKDKDGKTLYDVMIYDHRANQGNNKSVFAEKGYMTFSDDRQYLILTLYNGNNYEEMLNTQEQRITHPLLRSSFKEEIIRFDLNGFKLSRTDEDLFKNNHQMLNLSQLSKGKDSLRRYVDKKYVDIQEQLNQNYYPRVNHFAGKLDSMNNSQPAGNFLDRFSKMDKVRIVDNALNLARGAKDHVNGQNNDVVAVKKEIKKYEAEFHKKFTLSIACMILFFIGAPLGAIIRKGGLGMPAVISVVFFIIFHILTITGEKMVIQGITPAWQGMWMASAIILPIGMFLTYKATTDSALLDADIYRSIFRFIANVVSRKKHANTTTL